MKKTILSAITVLVFICTAQAHARSGNNSYGNNSLSGRSYHHTTPSYAQPGYNSFSPAPQRHYNNGGQIYMQDGYPRNNGTYVMPHLKTKPDNYQWNNLGNRKGW